MADDDRSARRKARYKYLVDLGFSAKEARRLRDQSGLRIESRVDRERRRISKKPIDKRTETENIRLAAIRSDDAPNIDQRQRRFMSRSERHQNFKDWSGTEFPQWAKDRIIAYNKSAGLPPIHSFGYRRFFFHYVERIADFENRAFADRGDSELRNQLNIPLRDRRTVNKRAVA
jgi:hypothetical protein